MEFDLMTRYASWQETANLARNLEGAGYSGMLYTETSQVPWMMIAAAATAAPSLTFSTGIAVAFPRSPMISAQVAWELAENTQGRFRLGLGSQVRGHIQRRYSIPYDKPAARMRDYILAVKACFRAFKGDERLKHEGPFYNLDLLPPQWSPPRHDYHDIKVDLAAVGPYMTRAAGEVADGVHVHPWHSMHYVENRLLPAVEEGAAKAGRSIGDIDFIVPVFAVPGDSEEERAQLLHRAKTQIAFYGSTPNYHFQWDDLGFEGMTQKMGELLRTGDTDAMAAEITDEMLEHYAVVARWDDMADRLIARYKGFASRVVMYLGQDDVFADSRRLGKWGEIANAVRAGEKAV